MKKLLTPLVLIAILVLAGATTYVVMQHYDTYQKEQWKKTDTELKARDAKAASQITVLTTENTNLKKDNLTLRTECMKGLTAFNKLPLATQKLIGGINCGE